MLKYMNRRWIYIFVITFLCLFIVTGTAFTYGYVNRVERGGNDYADGMATNAQKLMDYANQTIDSAMASVNAVFRSKWFDHYRNIAGIYAHEFDALKRIEIIQEMAAKVTVLPTVEDILIITPALDSVIGRCGWHTLERYEVIYGDVSLINHDGYLQYPEVECVDSKYAMMIMKDPTPRRDKSVACILFSRKQMASALDNMLPGDAIGMSASMNGAEICSLSDAPGDALTITLKRRVPEFELNVYFPSYETAEGVDVRWEYILEICLTFTISLMLAAVLASITTRPMSEMIRSFGGKPRDMDNPYQFIYEYVAAYSHHADSLQMQVNHLGDARDNFLNLMRNEIFCGILTNPDFNFSDEYITGFLPWICDGVPCLLAVIEPAISSAKVNLDEEKIAAGTEHIAFADIFGSKCVFLWYDGVQTADAARESLARLMGGEEQMSIAISDVIMGPEEFHTEYARLRDELEKRRRLREDMPISVQIALADGIRRKNADDCLQALGKFIEGDNMSAPMRFIMRDALEKGLDAEQLGREFAQARDADGRRQALKNALAALTQPAQKTVAGEPRDSDAGRRVLEYIRANFCDAELCVIKVADEFNMHRTQVSKLIKSATGVTFSDYVQTLRLGKAVSLIESSERALADIASDVGYASYLSFKRAFIRCYNVSPREYREHLLYSKLENT